MRGAFGRFRYEKPQPGLQFSSYEDATYPPRAYHYHIQQAPSPPLDVRGGGGCGRLSPQTGAPSLTTIVLPTVDPDAACGPAVRHGNPGGSSAMQAAVSTNSYLGRSASSVVSSGVDSGAGTNVGGPLDVERRPPPRLRFFFDCFVPDENGADVLSFADTWRYMEPLNPFHYHDLWCGIRGGASVSTEGGAMVNGAPMSRPLQEAVEPPHTTHGGPVPASSSYEQNGRESEDVIQEKGVRAGRASMSSPRAITLRAVLKVIQRTVRSVGLPEELSSMVLLATRVSPSTGLTRKEENRLRLRVQRRPAVPRPIRRGAKVYVPAAALSPTTGDAGALGEGGGRLVDVTALEQPWMDVAAAGVEGGRSGDHHHLARVTASTADEFAYDDDVELHSNRYAGGIRGSRTRGKRSRLGEADEPDLEDDVLEEDDIPLIASIRWGADGTGRADVSGDGTVAAASGVAGTVVTHMDEEGEELDEEDDLSTGLVDDDDDENVASGDDDVHEDEDGFGGGDDGDDGF